jgi:hypothetical protein
MAKSRGRNQTVSSSESEAPTPCLPQALERD